MFDIDDNVVLENGENALSIKNLKEVGTDKLFLLGVTTSGRQVVWDDEGYIVNKDHIHPYDISNVKGKRNETI